MPVRRRDHDTKARRGRGLPAGGLIVAAALLTIALSACVAATPPPTPSTQPPTASPTDTPRLLPTDAPEPTPEPAYDFMTSSPIRGQPLDSPEATYELYLRDAIRQTEQIQQKRLTLRLRYEAPGVTTPDLGGLVVSVRLLEDRSTFTMPNDNTAIFSGDFDLLVTFADQSTAMRYCTWMVTLERTRNGTWYVINPSELPLFSVCIT